LNFQVNGQSHSASCDPGSSLLSLLRSLGYAGVHRVCETGDCGSCTVWVEGNPIHSCIYPAMRADSRPVTTIEGLADGEKLSPMQQAFLDKQGFQFGYCTPGMIMTASKLKVESPAELKAELEGNLCRCTGYEAIIESVLECGDKLAAGSRERNAAQQCYFMRPTTNGSGHKILLLEFPKTNTLFADGHSLAESSDFISRTPRSSRKFRSLS